MFKKIIFTVSFIIISFCGIAQKSLNDYKYIIIPKSFEFSKSDDQYQLNSLLKFLFNKYGYDVYFMDDIPESLKKDRCLALIAEVSKEKSSMFKTKLEIALKDCYDNVIMTSKIGESRAKEYNKAYNLALRDAFETFQNIDYKYMEKVIVSKSLETEKQQLSETTKVEEKHEIDLIETKSKEKTEGVKIEFPKVTETELYYAQANKNGFQLVNSEPRIVMVLLTTAVEEVYIVKDKNAIVFKEDGFWYYSENNGQLGEKKNLNIKF